MRRTNDGGLSSSGGDDLNDSVGSALRRADAYLSETLDINVEAGLVNLHRQARRGDTRVGRMLVRMAAMLALPGLVLLVLLLAQSSTTFPLAGAVGAGTVIAVEIGRAALTAWATVDEDTRSRVRHHLQRGLHGTTFD